MKMRNSQAVIRGDRPTTRFAAPIGQPRARHLGLRHTTPTRLAQAPVDTLAATPMIAIRSAARGHLGLARAVTKQPFHRNRSMTWSSARTPFRTGTPAQRCSVARLTKQGADRTAAAGGLAPPALRRVAESSSARPNGQAGDLLGRRRERDGSSGLCPRERLTTPRLSRRRPSARSGRRRGSR